MYDHIKNEAFGSSNFSRDELIELGLNASGRKLRDQVKTWESYTDEKADVARDLMRGVRSLYREAPIEKGFRTLSIGSSEEPQFQLLHALSDGGLWLYDCDAAALDARRAHTERNLLKGVHFSKGNYLQDFQNEKSAESALNTRFGGATFELITLHHALYYCQSEDWPTLLQLLCSKLLNAPGRMHLALMSSSAERPHTTTWLYNRFAEKFCGTRNTQNLLELPDQMRGLVRTEDLHFSARSSAVRCRPKSFEDVMAVVWMIMLYPQIHDFSEDQKVEIAEFVLDEFWLPGRDLVQEQDYLTIAKSPQSWQTYMG